MATKNIQLQFFQITFMKFIYKEEDRGIYFAIKGYKKFENQ